MAMSDEQKKLRRWFRDHGWHTSDTPTGQGFYLESPIENCAGSTEWATDPKTGKDRLFSKERFLAVELDRFSCDYLTFQVFTRKHWWKRDPSIMEKDIGGYTWVPSDDFGEWPRWGVSVNIPARDIVKMADLIKAAQADWMKCRKTKNHLNFMERIAKSCLIRWIGVNSSYDEIKWAYSNERLRQERGYAAAREQEVMANGNPG